jgi:hypothetical protein
MGLKWWVTCAWLCRQEETSGQQIELGPSKHLALEPLQASDVPFDRALAPGQGHGSLDGGHVGPEPFGEAPKGRESARGGTSQPRFELARPTLTN